MDSVYWDIFPDADGADTSEDEADGESSCSPCLKVPCARCRNRSRLCNRCREIQRRLQRPSTLPTRKSSLELACSPEHIPPSSARHCSTTPEAAIPEVVLQHPSSGNESPGTSQKNALSVPGPTYAPMYTNSPSWMSTYSSSTCATTYTTSHERSRRDGEAGVDRNWLDVRRRRPPYPRRPRTTRRDNDARSVAGGWERRSTAWGSGAGSGWGVEIRGWDEGEIESGSYCVVEGARWEEQRAVAPRQQRPQKNAVGKGRRRWREEFGYLPKEGKMRALPLVELPTPRYIYDVLAVPSLGSKPQWMPYVSDTGHARVVYSVAYVRGTGHARGLWVLFVPQDKVVNDSLGFVWREGIWKGILGLLNHVLSFGRGGGGVDDVD